MWRALQMLGNVLAMGRALLLEGSNLRAGFARRLSQRNRVGEAFISGLDITIVGFLTTIEHLGGIVIAPGYTDR